MGNTEIFNSIATGYDTSERITIANIAANAIREYIIEGDKMSAIDFGCGTGLVGMNLRNDFKSLLFLDTSQNMLDQINQKITELKLQNAKTLCFDLEKENLSELQADYIFMAQVLLHIEDTELILKRLFEVLNAEGHLIIVDFNKNDAVKSDKVHNGFEVDEIIKMMSEIGYRDMSSKTIYTGSEIFMNQDASLFILDAKK